MWTRDQMIEERNYWNDSRVQASMRSKPYKVLSSKKHTTRVELCEYLHNRLIEGEVLPEDHDGIFELATRFEVCDLCRGSGHVVNPGIDCGGLTQEDFDEDPDFAEDYLSGVYDQPCPQCHGNRVVPNVEFPKNIQEAIDEFIRDEIEYAREVARERAMGC